MRNLIYVYLFLTGCQATAAAPQTDSKTKGNCPAEPVMCPQIYMPSKCSVSVGGKIFEATGSNSCFAKAALVAKLCKLKDAQAALANIKCVATSE